MTKRNKLITIFIVAVFAICAAVGGFVLNESSNGQFVRKFPQNRGRPADNPKGIDDLRKRAEQGDMIAQYDLGVSYRQGDGVRKDYEKAAQWWLRSAEQGNAEAQYLLGASYAIGEGVPQNDAESMKWWIRAAEQGHKKAQHLLDEWKNAPRDNIKEAYIWLSIMADKGFSGAVKGRDEAKAMLSPADISDADAEIERIRHSNAPVGD